MKKFTETKTVVVCHPDHDDREVLVTVTNDSYTICEGDPYVLVRWFSERECNSVEDTYDTEWDGMPTDERIAERVRETEDAEFAYVK